MNGISLSSVDHGAERHLLGGRVANRQVARSLGQALGILVGHAAVDEMTAGGHTDLPLMEERAPGADARGPVEVGHVIQDDQR
jgi:hypothetical protein